MVLLVGVCGGTLYSTSTPAVLSFDHARNMSQSQASYRCRWSIDAPANEHVEVNVTNVSLADLTSADCNNVYLELRDQPLVSLLLITYLQYCRICVPYHVILVANRCCYSQRWIKFLFGSRLNRDNGALSLFLFLLFFFFFLYLYFIIYSFVHTRSFTYSFITATSLLSRQNLSGDSDYF